MHTRSGGGRDVPWRLHCALALLGGAVLLPVPATAGDLAPARPPSASPGFSLGALLSKPLPGTPERRLYDRCAALEAALAFCEGVQRARVTTPGALPDGQSPATAEPPPHFLVQVSFAPAPRHIEAEGLIAVCLRADGRLSREQISIVDGEGVALVSAGQTSPAGPVSPAGATAGRWVLVRESGAWWGGALVVVVALSALALGLRRSARRRVAPAAAAVRAPGFGVDAAVALIQQEGPEVGGAALALLDERTREAVARACPAARGLPVPARPVRGEVRAVIASAISGR